MYVPFIAIILGVVLGLVQFFHEHIYEVCKNFYDKIISVSAGISISYIFLDLFPNFTNEATITNRYIFISVLIGFALLHLIEKYVYQHTSPSLIEKRLEISNQLISFIYHFILGIIILDFAEESIPEAILLFIPIVIFTAVSTIPIQQHPSKKVNFIVALSTPTGVIIAFLLQSILTLEIITILIGVVIGGLLFSIIRHSIPMGANGKPSYFLLGILIYVPIIILGWSL